MDSEGYPQNLEIPRYLKGPTICWLPITLRWVTYSEILFHSLKPFKMTWVYLLWNSKCLVFFRSEVASLKDSNC
jgi:hypothetical protein